MGRIFRLRSLLGSCFITLLVFFVLRIVIFRVEVGVNFIIVIEGAILSCGLVKGVVQEFVFEEVGVLITLDVVTNIIFDILHLSNCDLPFFQSPFCF